MTQQLTPTEAIDRHGFWSPEAFEKELTEIFRKSWLFVAHESELQQAGDYVTRRVGLEPVIVVRDEDSKVQVYLNTCPHRGGQLCRADMGNSSHFRCSYHGWTFSNKGQLRGVPELRTAYPPNFNRKEHGLFAAAGVETFAGFVFATFDPDAPSLEEYLGDMAWYLETYFAKVPMEVAGPPMRGVLHTNWKVGAENYAGDGYHVGTTHRSAVELGVFGNPAEMAKLGPITDGEAYCIDAGNGHCLRVQKLPIDFAIPMFLGYPPQMWETLTADLTPAQVDANAGLAVVHGNVFPNLSFIEAIGPSEPNRMPVAQIQLRQWQPISADRTELVIWTLTPKDAPEEWKQESQQALTRTLGFGGLFETDDLQNWSGMSDTNRSELAWEKELVYESLVGELTDEKDWPGTVYRADHSEVGLLALHRRWHELMDR